MAHALIEVFVAMPFGSSADPRLTERCDRRGAAIDDVCDTVGCEAQRVDMTVGAIDIMRQAKRMIRSAGICIFDLTDERPSVYYEACYAHGIRHKKRRTIFIAERGTKLHFDIAHQSVLFFTDTIHLRAALREHLEAMLKSEREDMESENAEHEFEDEEDADDDEDQNEEYE